MGFLMRLAVAAVLTSVLNTGVAQPAPPFDPVNLKQGSYLGGHQRGVTALTIAGNRIASSSADKTVRLWDYTSRKLIAVTPAQDNVISGLALSHDGSVVAQSSADLIQIWRTKAQGDTPIQQIEVVARLTGTAPVVSLAFSMEGQTLVSGDTAGNITYWDTATWQQKGAVGGHNGNVSALAFAPNNALLASGGADAVVKIWNPATWSLITSLTGHSGEITALAFSPDSGQLASASNDRTANIWNLKTAKLSATLTGHTAAIKSVAFSPNGKTVATGGLEASIRIWESATFKLINKLSTSTVVYLPCVVFGPDGQALISGSNTGEIALWQTFLPSAPGPISNPVTPPTPGPSPTPNPITPPTPTCCRVCTVGKACGNSCIALDRTCNVGPGCACNG